MIGELIKKATRTVYGEKVCRVVVDIPYEEVKDAERGDQDMLEWLDNRVDQEVKLEIGPFDDEGQSTVYDRVFEGELEEDHDGLNEVTEG